MPICNDVPPCLPCNPCTTCDPCGPNYTDVGCCEFVKSSCVIYNGEDIPCLTITKNENLNVILQDLKNIVCALTPTGYGTFNFGCFASQGITTEKQFVEFISSIICQILGTQVPGGVTSLSQLYALIQALTTDVNLIKNQTLITCFRTLSGLTTPQNISVLLQSIQTVICSLDVRITAIEVGGGLSITTVNTNHNVVIAASGIANHTLSADVRIDPDASNSITTSNVGVLCTSPAISTVNTQSINLIASGIKNHTITGNVKISATVNNAVSILTDGLYVNPASASETPLVATNSTSIGFTQSGVSGHTFTGSVKLDPSLLNIAQITASGLLVSSALTQDPITPINTQSINLTVSGSSGHTLRSDVVISPTANNGLVLLTNGLYTQSATGLFWGLSGNSILSTDFIGSTNSQPLNIKINNVKSGRLYSSGDTSFGYQAGLTNTSGVITAIGNQALKANTSSSENTAIGNQALKANIIGASNTAIGDVSLLNSDGNFNTGVGSSTLNKLTIGQGNTAVGSFAGTNYAIGAELVGSFNTFLGYGATNSNGQPNISTSVAIGKNAFVSANNMVVLGGTGTDKVSVVVGGSQADASSIMELVSVTQGFLPPRGTTIQRSAIVSPATGLIVYSTTTNSNHVYNGTNWTGDIIVSGTATLTLGHGTDYIFTGTTTTWTLPAVSVSLLGRGNKITIKNRGSGTITLNSNVGTTIYSTLAVSTLSILTNTSIVLMPDGTYFNVE